MEKIKQEKKSMKSETKMRRSTKYTLRFATQKKRELLNKLFSIYGANLQKTIDLLWNEEVPLRKWLSSKQIDWMNSFGGQYKSLVYKQASEIVRGCRFKKRKSKPVVKNFAIDLTQLQTRVEISHNTFDKWIRIRLPFIMPDKRRERIEIFIPIKEHKHSLKFNGWKQAKTIKLGKNYLRLTFEKEMPELKQKGRILGIDSGYKNLLTTSDGQFIGKGFNNIYEKIAHKKQGSKAFKKALIERDQTINGIINKKLNLASVKEVRVENLKGLKQGIKGHFRKSFNNKFQRWTYRKVLDKLERMTQEEAVQFVRVPPAYTSQTCPECQFVHKNNRKLEYFRCINCGYENHSDIVGAMNIARQEHIDPVVKKLSEKVVP